MKIWKIADAWYKFAPTVTLYHGTTESNLNSIITEGFQPFDASKKLDEILSRYGYSRDMVPDWILKSEMRLRENKPYIYFTTYKKQAASYSKKPFGEFELSIIRGLNYMAKRKGRRYYTTSRI